MQIEAGNYLLRIFILFSTKAIFKEGTSKTKKFRQTWSKHLKTFSHFAIFYLHHIKTELDYYHQSPNVQAILQIVERKELGKLRNLKKDSEIPRIISNFLADPTEQKFRQSC